MRRRRRWRRRSIRIRSFFKKRGNRKEAEEAKAQEAEEDKLEGKDETDDELERKAGHQAQ